MSDEATSERSPLYRIGRLAERAGVSRQVASTYCMYGLVTEAARTAGGQRLFDESAIRRVRLIHDLNRRYTLREIREIFLHERL